MPWTAKTLLVTDQNPDAVERYVALSYEGHEPYGADDYEEGENVDRKAFYGKGNDGPGAGLVGYFAEPSKWVDQIVARLNYFTPGFDEGWRWQTFEMLNKEDHGDDFVKSLKKGVSAIIDPEGNERGFMLGRANSPAVYVVLAVLNQGPVPLAEGENSIK